LTQADVQPGRYTYDQGWDREGERLAALARVADPGTRRHLLALGLQPGWRCLEIGAGAGTVARWLAEGVAPGGHVVATDLDTRHLDAGDRDNLEVRRHDIRSDELEAAHYDLIHARMVLQHIPEREEIVPRLVAALRPGGWLLLEDVDLAAPMGEVMSRYAPDDRRDTVRAVLRAFDLGMAALGAENSFGARLPQVMLGAGLTDIGGELRAPLLVHDPDRPHWGALSLLQVRDEFVAHGLLDAETADRALSALDDAGSITLNVPLMAVWGRRPPPG
jgi:SAM-dependent methyltransferase